MDIHYPDVLAGQTVSAENYPDTKRHNELELNLVEKGELLYFLNGQCIQLQQDTLLMFRAALPHRILEASADACLHWMSIPMKFFFWWQSGDLRERILEGSPLMLPLEKSPVTGMLFRQWQRDLQMNNPEHRKILLLEVEAFIRRLTLNHFTPRYDSSMVVEPETAGLRHVEKMVSFIHEAYPKNLSVPDISDAAELHPHYAMALFREHLQIRITAYLVRYRLAIAARKLLLTETPIQEIAPTVGFGSVNHFHTSFKKHYGTTPRLYRKEAHHPDSQRKKSRKTRRKKASKKESVKAQV